MALSVTSRPQRSPPQPVAASTSKRTSPGRRAARPAARELVVRVAADSDYDAVVIGAGVSGLSTAFTLGRSSPGVRMLVTEARDRVGGNITTKNENGYIWEEGPNSYQPGDAILTVACDAGMRDDILLADPNSDRYVLWDEELRALPKDIPTAVLGTFLTWPGKIRAGLGAIGIDARARRNPSRDRLQRNTDARRLSSSSTSTLLQRLRGRPRGALVRRGHRQGQRLEPRRLPRLRRPQGAEGGIRRQGEARESATAKGGGPDGGILPRGLKTFPKGLAKALGSEKVKLEWKVTKIAKRDDGSFAISPTTPRPVEKTITTAAVVMTAPTYVTADTVQDMAPDAAAALRKFYYPPVASVTVSTPVPSVWTEHPRFASRRSHRARAASPAVAWASARSAPSTRPTCSRTISASRRVSS